MGTSINQHSPRNPRWKPLHTTYENDKIPEENVLKELWRAADNPTEAVRWSNEMKSDIIYSCYEIINSSDNFQEALSKFNNEVFSTKTNSIAAELAKRAIPNAYQSSNPSAEWTNKIFSEITNYIISRDISGFVGEKFRNKTVKDLDAFKQRLNSNLNEILRMQKKGIKTRKDWNGFVDDTIKKLKSSK